MSDDPIIHIIISSIPAFYFSYILIQGIWGTGTISVNCKAKNFRTSIQGSLVVGSAGLTAMLGYGLCHFHCKKSGEAPYLPMWLMVFMLVSSIIALVFQFGILNGYSSSDPNDLPCKKDNNFKTFTTIGVVLSFIALFSSLIVIVRNIKKKNIQAKKKKEDIIKQVEKQELQSEKKKKEEKEKLEKEKAELEKLRKEVAQKNKSKTQEEVEIENLKEQKILLEEIRKKNLEEQRKKVKEQKEELDRLKEEKKLKDDQIKSRLELRKLEEEMNREQQLPIRRAPIRRDEEDDEKEGMPPAVQRIRPNFF